MNRLLITVCTILLSYSSIAQNYTEPFWNQQMPVKTRISDLISRLTIEEKISFLSETSPGIPRLGVPKYFMGNEALHGVVRPGKFTVFPQSIGLAATWNPELIYDITTAISDEARGRWNELKQGMLQNDQFSDLLVFWSPDINLARDPRWGRTQETYGEDPFLSSRMAVAFIQGLQGKDPNYLKVVATPKHYTANNEEHNRFECNALFSERSLREYYLVPFEYAIKEGRAESIMTAYNSINGIPCTMSKKLITDILRKEWGFNGFVVSDCGAPGLIVSDHKYFQTLDSAAAACMNAGLDLECGGYCGKDCYIYKNYLKTALEKTWINQSQIDSAVYRVLMARFKMGVFDRDLSSNPYNLIPPAIVGCEKHQKLALQAALESIVLLKNSDNILPLDKSKIKSVAVFGPNAANCEFGGYSAKESFNEPVSVLQGLKNKLGKNVVINYKSWETITKKKQNQFQEEKALAAKSEYVIVVLGLNTQIENEGTDKKDIDLPANQEAFIKEIYSANPNTIVVLESGSPLAVNWINNNIPAVLNAWYAGEQGGIAIAKVIFGEYNPAGRLPITYPKSTADLLPFDDYEIMKGRTYMYSNKVPLYPFGYGLSYTAFQYSNFQMDNFDLKNKDSVLISINVTNTGNYDGDEVVQLYIKNKASSFIQPIKALKGFKRIYIKKNESKTVKLAIKSEDLRYFDENKNSFVIDPGLYAIQIGASSEDIRLEAEFEVR